MTSGVRFFYSGQRIIKGGCMKKLWILFVIGFSTQAFAQLGIQEKSFTVIPDPVYIESLQKIFPSTDADVLSEAYGLQILISSKPKEKTIRLQNLETLESTSSIALQSFQFVSDQAGDGSGFYTWFQINGVPIGVRYLPYEWAYR